MRYGKEASVVVVSLKQQQAKTIAPLLLRSRSQSTPFAI